MAYDPIPGPPIPGVLRPPDLDGRMEWVSLRRPAGLLDALEARLGSEVNLDKVALAVLCPLRAALDGPPLEALLARLPYPLAREVLDCERILNARVSPPTGAGDYVVLVAGLLQHPPPSAALYARAVFGAAKAVLSRADAEEIAARLPGDLAELWRDAR